MHSKKARVTDRMGEVTLGDNAGHFLVGDMEGVGPYAIIKSASWWLDNVQHIVEWLDDTGIGARFKHEGMVLTFECKEDLAMFIMRWG
jgi:hypothetical protein